MIKRDKCTDLAHGAAREAARKSDDKIIKPDKLTVIIKGDATTILFHPQGNEIFTNRRTP
jgi:hypothetical protein